MPPADRWRLPAWGAIAVLPRLRCGMDGSGGTPPGGPLSLSLLPGGDRGDVPRAPRPAGAVGRRWGAGWAGGADPGIWITQTQYSLLQVILSYVLG